MSDLMVMQQCVMVVYNYNVTLPNGLNGTSTGPATWRQLYAGQYLDYIDDRATLAQLPSYVQVCGESSRLGWLTLSCQTDEARDECGADAAF